ncbi:MAG: PHP domain-containing protein, partial [Gemmatimonadales bacterium]
GVPIALEDVTRAAGSGALGRPHVARALVAAGATADLDEAFARFLGRGRPAFVEKPLPALGEITALVHAAGGLAVAAHLGNRGSAAELRRLRDAGLDGVEVRHPSHTAAVEARLTRVAGELDLAVSGGSDWHGDGELGASHAPLGGLDVPAEWLDHLERRREKTSREDVGKHRHAGTER